METHIAEHRFHHTSFVLYISVDDLIPAQGPAIPGLDEFSASLDHRGIPAVWLSSRTRLQLDEPRRKLAHTHPFIAEDGCGVFLPEDYFHLRPQNSPSQSGKTPTVRLGRYTCLPVAEQLPAASDALETLSADTGVTVVPLRSLPPRELAQNLALSPREAELARQRDFDELFFFAGASPQDVEKFLAVGNRQGIQLRPRGVLWSVAIGANVRKCITELSKLYDRALRSHARSIAIATQGQHLALFAACDRAILLTDDGNPRSRDRVLSASPQENRVIELPRKSPDVWEHVLATLTGQR